MNFRLILVGLCLGAALLPASTIYGAGSNGDLYMIDPTTGTTTLIGAMGVTMYDIAEYDGALYGINGTSDLYSINTTTGHATEIGTGTGEALNSLTFNSSGVLYAAGLNTTDMYTIDYMGAGAGAATEVAGETNSTAYNASGDLEFIGSTLYLLVGGDTGGASSLDTVNLATGALTVLGATGYDNVFGLSYLNGTLYGFTDPTSGTDEVISLSTTTGAGAIVHSYSPGFYGATDDPYVATPEPATFGLAGLALVAISALRRL